MTVAHVRVVVPTRTLGNKETMRLLSTLYPGHIVNSKEVRNHHTSCWLELPDLAQGDAEAHVREALAANAVHGDDVKVESYKPRPYDQRRHKGQGSPWRDRREVLPRRST